MNVVDVRSNTSPSELRLKKAAFGVELVFKASPPCAANSIVEARQLLDTDRPLLHASCQSRFQPRRPFPNSPPLPPRGTMTSMFPSSPRSISPTAARSVIGTIWIDSAGSPAEAIQVRSRSQAFRCDCGRRTARMISYSYHQ